MIFKKYYIFIQKNLILEQMFQNEYVLLEFQALVDLTSLNLRMNFHHKYKFLFHHQDMPLNLFFLYNHPHHVNEHGIYFSLILR